MKNILLITILLFSSYAQAYQLDEVIVATPEAKLVNVFPCTWEESTYTCFEINLEKIPYRVAVDEGGEVVTVFTPVSDRYPEGIVPVEDLMRAGSI